MIKKIFIAFVTLLFLTAFVTAQTNHPTPQDSALLSAGINTAIHAAEAATGHAPLIPFLPDSATGSILTAFGLFIWRIIEKRKLRKAGLLNDKPAPTDKA